MDPGAAKGEFTPVMDTAAVLSNISSWEIPNRNEGFQLGQSWEYHLFGEVSSWENHRSKWGIAQQCLMNLEGSSLLVI